MGSNDKMTSDTAMQELTFRGCKAEQQSSTFHMTFLNLLIRWPNVAGKKEKIINV